MYEKSWEEVKFPTNRYKLFQTPDDWLKSRQCDGGAENLWRVHDNLYDLSSFVEKHPGGAMWLSLTQGTDITEAFEAHHFTKSAENKLPEFFVRKASTPRNSPFTFEPNGFYCTLRERARKHFDYKMPPVSRLSKICVDSYFLGLLIFCMLAAKLQSVSLAVIAGIFGGLIICSVHNFVHKKDSWRNYYYYFVGYSVREWRINHCLSHHLYPNTLIDTEISLFEPVLEFIPTKDKPMWQRFGSWLYFPIVCSLVPFFQILGRIRAGTFFKVDYLVFFPLLLMFVFGGVSTKILNLWIIALAVEGFIFVFIGLTAAHHHPDIFHEGDKPREDRDWGLYQYDTILDRVEITGNKFIGLIVFGDHTLHHLFPTIDFCYLQELMPLYYKTLDEFGVPQKFEPFAEVTLGCFKQLARNTVSMADRVQKRKVL